MNSAVLSACERYRYRLTRTWNDGGRIACFIMLNPSTADALVDDPTIRRCVGFAKLWGFDGLEVVNLFAYRATKPSDLVKADDPIGPMNEEVIIDAGNRASQIFCAWGCDKAIIQHQDKRVIRLLWAHPLSCLGLTKHGYPKHPLYIAAVQMPIIFHNPTVPGCSIEEATP